VKHKIDQCPACLDIKAAMTAANVLIAERNRNPNPETEARVQRADDKVNRVFQPFYAHVPTSAVRPLLDRILETMAKAAA
jgi:hypothetical protein